MRRLLATIGAYLEQHPVGRVFHSPADISWSADALVQPDVFVADAAEVRTLDWSNVKTLLIVIEVLSPSTARADRFTKRRLYQDAQVPVYWVVDPDRQMVEVWRPHDEQPRVERRYATWPPTGAFENLVLDLENLFRPL